MPGARASTIVEHLTARRDEMVELVGRLVQLESPTSEPTTQAAVLRLVGERLARHGYRTRRSSGRASGGSALYVPSDRPRGRPYQVLLGHGDTVWPVGTLESMPVRVEDGRLHGPGAFDMKAGLVQGIFAIGALCELVGVPEVTPVFFVNTDEETGSRESTRALRRLARCADRVWVLEPAMGDRGALKTTRKGLGRFTVVVRGAAAHAGLDPEGGASAILELSIVVQKLFALGDPRRGVTVNVGMIDGGVQPNVIAPHSRAVVDVRAPTHDDARRVEAAIRAIAPDTPGTTIEIDGAFGRPPMERTPGNRALWAIARDAAGELGIELEQAAAGGGSDGNTTSLVAPTLDGLGAVGSGAHARHESLLVERLVERASLLACLLAHPAVRSGRGGETR